MTGNIPDTTDDRLNGDPDALLQDSSRSSEEKRQALLDWRQDLLELQHATEENMSPDAAREGQLADKLSEVSDALSKLDERNGNPD